MRGYAFWAAFWVLLLLPVILVFAGKRSSSRRALREDGGGSEDCVRFARGFGALSSILPVGLLLLGFWPLSVLNGTVTSLMLYIPILGTLAGLSALGLYLFSAQGVERWIGSLASILALGWLVFFVSIGLLGV